MIETFFPNAERLLIDSDLSICAVEAAMWRHITADDPPRFVLHVADSKDPVAQEMAAHFHLQVCGVKGAGPDEWALEDMKTGKVIFSPKV